MELLGLLAQRYGVDSRDARPGAGVGSQLVGGAAHRRAIDE